MKLDLLLSAGTILTLDTDRPTAERVGVLGGRIVGFDEEIEGLEAARTVDFGSGTITPGLIDAHCHAIWWGLNLAQADYSHIRKLEDFFDVLSEQVSRIPAQPDPSRWLLGHSFNQYSSGSEYPRLEEIDRITGNVPLYIRHASGHAAIVNSAALRMIGALEPGFSDPTGGVVCRDASGRPTGLLEEAAQALAQAHILPFPLSELVDALEEATERFAAQGITSFGEAGIGAGWISHSPVEFAAYQQAVSEGRLHARAQLMPVLDALQPLSAHQSDFFGAEESIGLSLGIGSGFGNASLRLGHVKVFLDGALVSKTAAVSDVMCSHGSGHGYLLGEPAEYRRRTLAAYRAGWPLALHAIGDIAIDLALDLIAEAQEKYGLLSVPNRIEHFGLSRPEQVERAGALGISVVPQMGFIRDLGDQLIASVDPERESWLYRGRSVIDAGAGLIGSSDLPVIGNNIRMAMDAAVQRTTSSGRVLNSAERIDRSEALRMHTVWPAHAMGLSDDRGTLERGKLADFTVFSGNPLTSSTMQELEILATFVGGKETYAK
ncbi:amidohydrolase [Microbacterium profundi]